MRAVIPENFDLSVHKTAYPPENFGITTFRDDHALHILSLITLIPSRNKQVANNMNDGYTPLYSKLLQSVVHDYKQYLDYYVETQVLECDNKYWTAYAQLGGKSRGYRFCEQYQRTPTQVVDYSERFGKILKKQRKNDYQKLGQEYAHLTKWLWPNCGLEINAPLAFQFLQVRRDAQLNNPALREVKKKKGKRTFLNFNKHPKTKDPEVQYRLGRANVESIRIGDIGCTVDTTVGRMHTILTNMKGDLRNLITHRGESLVSLDITNSQPYLATVLLNIQSINDTNRVGNNTHKVLQNILKDKNPMIYSLMLEEIGQCIDNEDFNIFMNLVSDSVGNTESLYQFMLTRLTEMGKEGIDRSKVKELMFEILFSKIYNKRGKLIKTEGKQLFNSLFPSVYRVFAVIKSTDYKTLAHWLQRIESFIMLNVITKRIAKKHPLIPMFTIHDSIVVPVQYEAIVRKIMEEELQNATGLPPRIKADYWKPELLNWDKYGGKP